MTAGSSSSNCKLDSEKVKKRLGNCFKKHLPGNLIPGSSNFPYLQILSSGGLTIPSINLVNYVCSAFEILGYWVDVITQFYLPPLTAAERILCHFYQITLSNIHAAYMSQLDEVL